MGAYFSLLVNGERHHFVVEFEIHKSGESCSELHHLVNAVRPPSVIDRNINVADSTAPFLLRL